MSNDLYAQLSEYGSQTREAREPLSATDVANRVDQVPTVAAVQAPNGPRGWLVAVGAAIAVFVLIGGSVWLVSGNGADTVDEPMATSVPVPTTVTSLPATTMPEGAPTTTLAMAPTPVGAELAMTWERLGDDPVFERAWMRAVTVGGPGLVAVGSTEQGGAAVWTSEDGTVWQRLEAASFERGDGEHERYMSDVAAGPAGLVAIGGSDPIGWVVPESAVMWHSVDGFDWTEIDDDAFDLAEVNAVTAGGPGFVAVGAAGSGDPAVWVSSDGLAWEQIGDPSLVVAPEYDFSYLDDVVAGGPGLVAVGCEVPAGGDNPGSDAGWEAWTHRQPGIWVSTDGYAWERLPDDAVVEPQLDLPNLGDVDGMIPDEVPTCISTVVAGTEGLVALGDWGDRTWTSTDGYTWTITQNFVTPELGFGVLLAAATVDGSRIVAVGEGPSIEHADNRSTVWYTGAAFWAYEASSETWYRVDLLEAISRVGMVNTNNMDYTAPSVVDDVVPFAEGFIAVGHDGYYSEESDRTDAAVWVGTWDNG